MRYFLYIVSVYCVLLMIKFSVAQRQGDLCVFAGTIQPGVCRHIWRCPAALEAAFNGIPHQVCANTDNRLIVCCPWVPGQETGLQARCPANAATPREGDNCTMVGTGREGVCSRFANCQTAIEASSKGISPQICAVEGTVQIVCCPLVAVAEGEQCTVAETGRAGKCLRISKCPVAVEAVLKGIIPQICTLDGSVPIVCCEGAVEESHHSLLIRNPVSDGSNCTLKDTRMAVVCRPFANCHSAKEAAREGIFPQRCDLTDNESELVCCSKADCPPLPKGLVTQLPTGSKAADYCIELAEKIHPCQETRFGWTRGVMCPLLTLLQDLNKQYHLTPMTTAAEAPFYGRIGSGRRGNIAWKGEPVTLVSDRWVLCSAYAINYIGSSKVQFVGLGGTFQPSYNPDEIFGVAKQFPHPLYNNDYSRAYNNIALLQLDREVTFTGRILPACLHTGTPLPNRGFIRTASDGSSTPENKMKMQRMSAEECSGVVPTGNSWHPDGFKHDVEICSSPVNTTGRCMGLYTGSPLTLPNSPRVACTHLLVGLASGGISLPCTYTYTRISAFIPWIEGIVWPKSGVVFN